MASLSVLTTERSISTVRSTPAMIVEDKQFRDLQASEARVRERCRELIMRELVGAIHREMYEITAWGVAYLRGDLDAEMLRRWDNR